MRFVCSCLFRALAISGIVGVFPVLIRADDSAARPNAPISQFKLPTFNSEGNRVSLLRGAEARYVSPTQIDLTAMDLTLYFGDGTDRVDTVLRAPSASVLLNDSKIRVRGDQQVHVTREDLDATGERWTYDHTDRRILIEKNVHVVFRMELKDLLK